MIDSKVHLESSARAALRRLAIVGLLVIVAGSTSTSCSTVSVTAKPERLTRDGIESARHIEAFTSEPLDALNRYARSAGILLDSALRFGRRGESEQAAAFYLKTAVDAHQLMLSGDPDLSPEMLRSLLTVYNAALGRFAEHWTSDPRRRGALPIDFDCEGERLQLVASDRSDHPPLYFDRAVAASSLRSEGMLDLHRAGVGAPLVGIREKTADRGEEVRFYPERGMHVSTTMVIESVREFDDTAGRRTRVTVALKNPALHETVAIGGRELPLAANFSAPIELLLTGHNGTLRGLGGFFQADKRAANSGIRLLEPYDPERIPVVLTHGLASVPIIWKDLIPALLAEPDLARNYQFMVFTYPSAYPIDPVRPPVSATSWRALRELLRSRGAAPALHPTWWASGTAWAVSSPTPWSPTLATACGDAISDEPFERTGSRPQDPRAGPNRWCSSIQTPASRAQSSCRPHTVAPPWHRPAFPCGSPDWRRFPATSSTPLATCWRTPTLRQALKHRSDQQSHQRAVTHPRLPHCPVALAASPYKPGVTYHSIIGDRGKGNTPDSSDGAVEYSSSHQPGAASELIVPTPHASYAHPATIAEIKRILRLHLGEDAAR